MNPLAHDEAEPAATRALVLVVDDQELNLELIDCVLQAGGFEVLRALDADAARAHWRARQPDLILMDIQLPGVDGLVLTRELKADPLRCHIPVIAFTAYAMQGDEERLRAAGCDGYLAKPVDVLTLPERVREWLADRPAGPHAPGLEADAH